MPCSMRNRLRAHVFWPVHVRACSDLTAYFIGGINLYPGYFLFSSLCPEMNHSMRKRQCTHVFLARVCTDFGIGSIILAHARGGSHSLVCTRKNRNSPPPPNPGGGVRSRDQIFVPPDFNSTIIGESSHRKSAP
jgi:hypothetical protein